MTDGTQYDDLTKQETEITIEKTWDKILVTLNGPESPSRSEAATILVNDKAWPTLTYNYWNEGSMTNDDLGPHYGTAVLVYHEDDFVDDSIPHLLRLFIPRLKLIGGLEAEM